MTTHAQLAARLLPEAAGIYRTLGGNADGQAQQQMEEYSTLYERVADMVEADPEGVVEGV